jgi:hypothetical protein
MILVRDTLNKNILAADIFSFSRWNSIDNEGKRQTFSDHRDFNMISKFYTKLKHRDSDFSQDGISDPVLKNINYDCLRLADHVLKNIGWKKYHTDSHKRLHLILSIAATLSSALAIFFIFEGYFLYSFSGSIWTIL